MSVCVVVDVKKSQSWIEFMRSNFEASLVVAVAFVVFISQVS